MKSLINTSQDFDTALDFVIQEQETFNKKIENEMSAAEFNNIFTEIESNINNLYEKIRVLEDIKNYTKDFVVRAIDERRKKIINSLNIIEKNVDEYQNTGYVAVAVGFDNVNEEILDRDGSVISSLQLKEGKLVMPSKNLSIEGFMSLTNLGQQKEIQTDGGQTERVLFAGAEPFVESSIGVTGVEGQYRTIYESEQPVEGGVSVEYEILFSSRADCNYFSINPVNCNVTEIRLTDFEGQVRNISPKTEFFSPPMDIQKANVVVNCSGYERVEIDVPSEPSEDAFDKSIVGSEMNG